MNRHGSNPWTHIAVGVLVVAAIVAVSLHCVGLCIRRAFASLHAKR